MHRGGITRGEAALIALVAATCIALHKTGDVLVDASFAVGVALSVRIGQRKLGDRLSDTEAERRELQERAAQCAVAELANTALRDKLRAEAVALQQMAEQRIADAEARAEQHVTDETARIRREFEETRATDLADAYYTGAMNERNGLHAEADGTAGADLIVLDERRRQHTTYGAGTTSS